MPKLKKSSPLKTLEELISDYDSATLVTALRNLKTNDISWQVFRAALMKEYISMAGYVLDSASKTGSQIEAAYQAGAAQTMYDTANVLIDKYIDVLEKRVSVIQSIRPEE